MRGLILLKALIVGDDAQEVRERRWDVSIRERRRLCGLVLASIHRPDHSGLGFL